MDASGHPKRTYLYIRQSTLYQVINNTESTARQYDLRGRAVALGWPADRIHVIDIDQGHSGASSADREGFQHLVAEVSLGRAGIVLGLECSRLARDYADWQQLLKICAHSDTLICDEDGLYDPASFNDRLVLGMKGHAEANCISCGPGMRGRILAKARRGELRLHLPIGLAHDAAATALDPDGGVRRRSAAVRHLYRHRLRLRRGQSLPPAQLTFPARHRGGPHAGELYFKTLTHDQVLKILHNPCYAGAYAYGRARHTTDLDGHHHTPDQAGRGLDRPSPRPPPRLHHLGPVPGQPARPGRQRRRPRRQPHSRASPGGTRPAPGPHRLRQMRTAHDGALPHPRRPHPRPGLPSARTTASATPSPPARPPQCRRRRRDPPR